AADEQVLVAVVVIIANRYTEVEIEIFTRQARLDGDIVESSVGALPQQAVVIRWVCLLHLRKLRAIGKEYVQAAVVIEIEDGHPAAHGLRKILVPSRAVVAAVGNLRARRHVREVGALGSLGGPARRQRHKQDGAETRYSQDDGALQLFLRRMGAGVRLRIPIVSGVRRVPGRRERHCQVPVYGSRGAQGDAKQGSNHQAAELHVLLVPRNRLSSREGASSRTATGSGIVTSYY